VVAVAGFWLSARLDRLGEPVAMVAAVGMVAVLVSPVSWIHHWQWGVVVIGALLGDGRGRRRVGTALAATVVLALKLPWWGGAWPGHGPLVTLAGRLCEQAYTVFAAGALVALWWVFVASKEGAQDAGVQKGVATPAAWSSVTAESTPHTPPPTRRTVASRIRRSSHRPTTAATAETSSSAAQEPTNTETGSR